MANPWGAPGPGPPDTGEGRRPQGECSTRRAPLPRRPAAGAPLGAAAMYMLCAGPRGGGSPAWRARAIQGSGLLVGQDVNEGHWEDPLPVRMSFDVPDLRGEKRGVGGRPATSPGGQGEPRVCPQSWGEMRADPLPPSGDSSRRTNYTTRRQQRNSTGQRRSARRWHLGLLSPARRSDAGARPGLHALRQGPWPPALPGDLGPRLLSLLSVKWGS